MESINKEAETGSQVAAKSEHGGERRGRAPRRSRRAWRELVLEYQASGASSAEFEAKRDIKHCALAKWIGLIKQEELERAGKFVEIKVLKPEPVEPQAEYIIRYQNGRELRLSSSFRIERVAELTALLEVAL